MARNEFETEVGILLKSLFPIALKLDDVAFNRDGGRQVTQKPWDYYGCTKKGRFWVAEAKRVRLRSFPFANLRDHQSVALEEAQKFAYSWLFINWRIGGFRGTGQAVWITYREYKAVMEDILATTGRISVRPEAFNEHWHLEKVTGGWKAPPKHPILLAPGFEYVTE